MIIGDKREMVVENIKKAVEDGDFYRKVEVSDPIVTDSEAMKICENYLFEKGIDKILKKVGEECTEVIIAGKANDKKETIYEIADLVYHVMVLMIEMGISLEDIQTELASRHVIDKKVKQEKMV